MTCYQENWIPNLMTSMNTALGLRQATLSLREHDPRRADLFETEASLISEALAGVIFEIDHIGSTAVPGLQAKPILDIALRLTE